MIVTKSGIPITNQKEIRVLAVRQPWASLIVEGLKLTTVRDIQVGNYCENCSIDCIHFNLDADCCDCDTFVGQLYSRCVDSEYINTEMKFELRK